MPSTKSKSKQDHEADVLTAIDELNNEQFEPFSSNDYLLDSYKEATICSIASEVEETIRNVGRFNCVDCLNVFNENDKVNSTMKAATHDRIPCISTVYVCKVAEKYLNIFIARPKFEYKLMLQTIFEAIDYENLYLRSNFQTHLEHKDFFAEIIVELFLRKRATSIARAKTLEEQQQMMRNKLNKTIHFVGQ